MKKKFIRILSIVAVMALALTVATTAFAKTATVSTSTKYLVNSDGSVTQVEVGANISNGTEGSQVAYLVKQNDSQSPSDANIYYLNQYQLDDQGACAITYKINIADLSAASNYETSVNLGSNAGDTFEGKTALELEYYTVTDNNDGTYTVLPVAGREITSITHGNTTVSPLVSTFSASLNERIEVLTAAVAGQENKISAGQIAAATKTVGSNTVNWLLQPIGGNTITEMGVVYGNYLFPALDENRNYNTGITNVKLVFEGFPDGYSIASESAKCNPYYKVGDALYVYNGSDFAAE